MSRLPAPSAPVTAQLLAQALGASVTLLAFDGQGRRCDGGEHPSIPAGLTLTTEQRAQLVAGTRTDLCAGPARFSALCAQGDDGLLWVALRPIEAALSLPRFAQHLAHAVRNSLSSIKLAVQTLAKSGALGAREQKRVTIAEREIARMERMISTASELARMPERPRERLSLPALLEAAVLATRPEVDARGVQLRLTVAPELAGLVGDARRLQLAMENLLVLGARAMPEGGELDVQLGQDSAGLALAVRDHGAAVPAAERETLFEPLASGTRAAGLDLALVAQVARELGGAALAEDAQPGLRIIVKVPHRKEGTHGHAAAGR